MSPSSFESPATSNEAAPRDLALHETPADKMRFARAPNSEKPYAEVEIPQIPSRPKKARQVTSSPEPEIIESFPPATSASATATASISANNRGIKRDLEVEDGIDVAAGEKRLRAENGDRDGVGKKRKVDEGAGIANGDGEDDDDDIQVL